MVTWTVLGADHQLVGPAEEFLEYLRVQGTSPNTVKSYARALALWWSYLYVFGLCWDRVSLAQVGGFLAWLRSGDGPGVTSIVPRQARFAESTIATRLRAVTSCYRFHELNGVGLGGDLVRLVHGTRAAYLPMLEHVARRRGRERAVVRVRTPRRAAPPVLTPGQIARICDACARVDAVTGEWAGRVRDRLLWELLAETGMFSGGHPRAAEVRSSCLRSSEADLRTLSIAAGVVQGCCAACHRCRVAVLSWAMSSRFAARAAVRSWSRSSSWRRRSMACCSR